ncbi:MAG: pyrimidine-nucleoside phosphorylase [Candidatus Sericytochromatia bacterium]|nr:MAG: pyrimidine-nucleoside phosphorylase [Candidatus Sericytochromatia bacterium]
MNIIDILANKRDKKKHSKEELEYLVKATLSGEIKDYQISAWLMAAYINGLDLEETTELTKLVAYSGDVLDLSSIKGTKVDKHSSGGVGDKVTLVLAPLLASAGLIVAKISGRGLGHTGGTVDKLEAIPGMRTSLSIDEFKNQLNEIGVSVIGQTQNLTPVDKIFYALRDVTATVDNIPLIVVSILSKKIAAGADIILLDIKFGSGAFMKTLENARNLAKMIVEVAKKLNKSVIVALSDMDQPLGYMIGHSLEVEEAIKTLKGKGPPDLTKICLKYGAILLYQAKKARSLEDAENILKRNINSGKALEKFKEMIIAQDGNPEVINNFDLMPKAEHKIEINSPKAGFITNLDAYKVAQSAKLLGAGRDKKEDEIDLSVGVELKVKKGAKVDKGQVLAILHANNLKYIEKAISEIEDAFSFDTKPPEQLPLVREVIY